MLLWLKSKFALIVAGIILISAVSAFFYFQMGQVDGQRMQNYSDHIANTVQELYTSGADSASQQITFEGGRGIEMPRDIGGDPYSLVISQSSVAVEIDDHRRASEFGLDVHLWNPDERNNTDHLPEQEVEWRDSINDNPLVISSTDESEINIWMMRLDNGTEEVRRVFIFE